MGDREMWVCARYSERLKSVMKLRYERGMWPYIVSSGEITFCSFLFDTGRELSAVVEGSFHGGMSGSEVACSPERRLCGVSHSVQLILE
jgi:hypothetical protein